MLEPPRFPGRFSELAEIAKSIRLLCGLENFKPQNLDALAYALHWYAGGMDFEDALHLAMSAKETGFKTFDKAFVDCAKAAETQLPVELA